MSDSEQQQRQKLRQMLRKRRRQLSPQQQLQASEQVCQQLQQIIQQQAIKTVGVYLAFDGELSLQPLIDYCLAQKVACYVPIVSAKQKGWMRFHRYLPKQDITSNQFGINEPVIDSQSFIEPEQLDLLIAPLLGFDAAGNRLGMGGGYYDRFLADSNLQWLAVAHDCQQLEQINAAPWDQALPRLITPSHDWHWSLSNR